MYIKKSKWISIVMKNAIFNFVAESLYWEQNENSIKLNKTVSWSIKDFNIISIMLSSLHFFDENSKIPIEKGIQIFEKTFLNFFKIWKDGQNKIYSVKYKNMDLLHIDSTKWASSYEKWKIYMWLESVYLYVFID